MISEQHQREATRYYTFHDESHIVGNITIGLRFYKFNDLIGCHDTGNHSSMYNAEISGNVAHTMLLEPPSINSGIEQNKRNVCTVSFPYSLNLIAIPFTKQDYSVYFWKLLLKLFPSESFLKMQKQRGRNLSIICAASECGGEWFIWLPKDPDIRTIDFLVNYPPIYGSELVASIVPNDKRLTEFLS